MKLSALFVAVGLLSSANAQQKVNTYAQKWDVATKMELLLENLAIGACEEDRKQDDIKLGLPALSSAGILVERVESRDARSYTLFDLYFSDGLGTKHYLCAKAKMKK